MDFNADADRLRAAFGWIKTERAQQPMISLAALIERAQARYALTPTLADWVHWSLMPASRAVQPKEPG